MGAPTIAPTCAVEPHTITTPLLLHFVGLVEKADTLIFCSKSLHVDFSLEKPTHRFFVGEADTSILVEKGHSSGPSLNCYYLISVPLTLENHLAHSVLYLYVFSDIVSSIIHLSN